MVKENENLTSRLGKMSRTQIVSHLTNDNTHLACVTIILELLDDSYKMKRLNNRLEKELKEVKLRKRRNLTTKRPRKTRHEWRAYFRQLKNDTLYKLGNKWGMRSLMSYNTRTMTGPPRATLKAERIELLIEHLEVMGRVLND
tara:strand:- start:703 stop:1131 length:429 start_codon:yes stop_codon:yes gene_type:complete